MTGAAQSASPPPGVSRPTCDDAAAVSAMAEDAFLATFAHLYPPEDLASFFPTWMPTEKAAAQIANPDWALAIWRDGTGAITGYIKLGPIDFALPASEPDARDAIELHHLYLLETAQGQGVAQALMDWALVEARARGSARIYLSVFVDNIRAQRFYARYGFYEVGKNAYQVGSTIDDDRIWRCDL